MAKARANPDDANFDAAPRFASLDALRGALLLLIVSHGFGLRQMLDPQRFGWISSQFTHRDWDGCSLWDLLAPVLLVVAGIALPFSYANRQGHGWLRQFAHAVLRAGILILIGIYLDSYKANQLVFDVRGCLQQIALAYLLAFLILPLGTPVRTVTIGFLLVGHAAAYVIYGLVSGLEVWSPHQHVGLVLDQWLRLPPHPAGLVAFNLISNEAIFLSGTLIGTLARSGLSPGYKVVIMTAASLLCILLGWVLAGGNGLISLRWHALIPSIPRIGTLSFVLLSVGWTLLAFTYFFTMIEGFLWQSWSLPITLVGRNALLLYVTSQLFRDWAVRSAKLVVPDARAIASVRPLLLELIVLAIFWLFCVWLYRRRIFYPSSTS